jgi:hypothetical protein
MKLKINFLAFLFLCSCSSRDVAQFSPAPAPPPNILPDTPPPNYIPDIKSIQVNTLPSPFNINGKLPFAVWVDGEMLPMNSKQSLMIVQALNIEFKEPKNTAQIHRGEGWLYLRPINE